MLSQPFPQRSRVPLVDRELLDLRLKHIHDPLNFVIDLSQIQVDLKLEHLTHQIIEAVSCKDKQHNDETS